MTSQSVWNDDLVGVLRTAAASVTETLEQFDQWQQRSTGHAAQFAADVAADLAVVECLTSNGLGVLSEESGLHEPDRPILVVVDPLDGSANASRRLPWYATSLCAVDADGPRAAFVVNQATGEHFEAVRGRGAYSATVRLTTSTTAQLTDASIACSGWPPSNPGWSELRILDAAALDLCAVSAGRIDGWVDWDADAHGPWDYLAAMLICEEAGGVVQDVFDRPLVTLNPATRRTPVAAGTRQLAAALTAWRRRDGPRMPATANTAP